MALHPPRIIPRSEHTVSRRMLSPNALRALYRLRDNGFTAYLVGGCVRDLLLGREPKDFDVATDATPNQVKRLFRNCRLVGRRFRLAHLHFGEEIIEVATFRSPQPAEETADPADDRSPRHLVDDEGMVLRDNVFGTPEEDALRRDFTVNALFYNVADFSIIDYADGLRDLEQGIIRTIGDPMQRFTEDPVRMIRAVRFAALLGFTIDDASWQTILELAPTITRATPPRLYEEILKLFLQGEGEQCYQLLRRTGLLAPLFPAFSAWLDVETDGFPHVWVSRALDHIDRIRSGGGQVAPHLFVALLFGQYLEEAAERFRSEGLNPQEATDRAVAEFIGETSPLVQIPHRVVLAVRQILLAQNRLRRMPGRQPRSFASRPGFAEALEYLRFRTETTGADQEVLAFWERFAGETETPPAAAPEEDTGEQVRRRRRRRRRKRRSGKEPGV